MTRQAATAMSTSTNKAPHTAPIMMAVLLWGRDSGEATVQLGKLFVQDKILKKFFRRAENKNSPTCPVLGPVLLLGNVFLKIQNTVPPGRWSITGELKDNKPPHVCVRFTKQDCTFVTESGRLFSFVWSHRADKTTRRLWTAPSGISLNLVCLNRLYICKQFNTARDGPSYILIPLCSGGDSDST